MYFLLVQQEPVIPVSSASLVGSYAPSVRSPYKKDRELLQTIFAPNFPLVLTSKGEFTFCDEGREGFWRCEGNQLVLINSRFFGMIFPVPDALLRKSNPGSNSLKGYRLRIQPDGSLILHNINQLRGDVVYRKKPRKSTKQLIRLASPDDGTITSNMIEAFTILAEERVTRFKDMLAIALDLQADFASRVGVVTMLGMEASSQFDADLRAAQLKVDASPWPKRDKKLALKTLNYALARSPNPEVSALLFDRTDVASYMLERSVETSRYRPSVERVRKMFNDKSTSMQASGCRIARLSGLNEMLPDCRKLLESADVHVRIGAAAAVFALSPDAPEKAAMIKSIVNILESPGVDYSRMTALDALAETHSPLAIEPLLTCLKTDSDMTYRRIAAQKLKLLGLPQAVPGLLIALKQAVSKEPDIAKSFEQNLDLGPVKKAIVEAIYALDPAAYEKYAKSK